VITETVIKEVPVEVLQPVPAQLTAPIPYPDPLPTQQSVADLVERLVLLYDLLDEANADRATVKRMAPPAGPAPMAPTVR
jgi:hypothetical protein